MLSEECFDEEYVVSDDIYSILSDLNNVPQSLEYLGEYNRILHEYCGGCMRFEHHPCRQISRIIGETALLLDKLPNDAIEYLKQMQFIRDYKEALRTGEITETDYGFVYDQLDDIELENDQRIDTIAIELAMARAGLYSVRISIERLDLLTSCEQVLNHTNNSDKYAN